MFEIGTLESAYMQSFAKKTQKCLKLGPKMPYLVILGWNLKTFFSNLKSGPSNLPKYKISRRNKNF